MELPITGRCLCGQVRYEITAEPVTTANCHCRTCQKAVGAAYFPALFVRTETLNISGIVKEYASLADSGHTMYRGFCPECGTALFGRNSHFTGIRPVSAASLDHPEIYVPKKDIWVSAAQPWDFMNPDLPKFSGNPWK